MNVLWMSDEVIEEEGSAVPRSQDVLPQVHFHFACLELYYALLWREVTAASRVMPKNSMEVLRFFFGMRDAEFVESFSEIILSHKLSTNSAPCELVK